MGNLCAGYMLSWFHYSWWEKIEAYFEIFNNFCVTVRGKRTSASSRTMSRNVRRLQESVNLHLNHYEKELFLDALNEFHSIRDTWGFVEVLHTLLNTPAKQQLVSTDPLSLCEANNRILGYNIRLAYLLHTLLTGAMFLFWCFYDPVFTPSELFSRYREA